MWILEAVHWSTDDMYIGFVLYLIGEEDEQDGWKDQELRRTLKEERTWNKLITIQSDDTKWTQQHRDVMESVLIE
jgi:hypothetical protein